MSDDRSVHIPFGRVELDGDLYLPENCQAVVVFAHGSGSSRHSPRNRYVASVLWSAGLGTLLLDLLTPLTSRCLQPASVPQPAGSGVVGPLLVPGTAENTVP